VTAEASHLFWHAVQSLANVHQHPDQAAHLVLDRAHVCFLQPHVFGENPQSRTEIVSAIIHYRQSSERLQTGRTASQHSQHTDVA